jgi:sucrose-6-phosphate hydrolase SacC (GH32 family)
MTAPASPAGTSTASSAAHLALRPTAHFTARDTWLNDPNGLVHHDGVYHLFFQSNPGGSTWGDIAWGHATSTDLVTWCEQPVAIAATDEEMVFSGSAVRDVRNTGGFAGAGQTALVAVYTSAYVAGPRRGIQAQSLAYSVDDGATWARHEGNPVLDVGSAEFRDPKVFWYGADDGYWVMVAVEATDQRVVLYRSTNLRDWTPLSEFGPAHATDGVWECPDLFPLRVRGTDETRWVLVVSLNPGGIAGGSGTQYFVGDFDGTTFTPSRLSGSTDPWTFDWLDYGHDLYAAVSFNDAPDGRRLMIGWASNWSYARDTPTAPWRSAMSLVREVELVRTGDGRLRLAQTPVLPPEAEHLLTEREHPLTEREHPRDPARGGLRRFDVRVPCEPGTRARLVLSSRSSADRVELVVDGDARTLSSDRTASGTVDFHPDFPVVDTAPLLGDGDECELTVVVDGCVLEVYADGGLATLTQLVFPSAPLTELDVTVRGSGTGSDPGTSSATGG